MFFLLLSIVFFYDENDLRAKIQLRNFYILSGMEALLVDLPASIYLWGLL